MSPPLLFIGLGGGPTPAGPHFAPGDLVAHRRYGYRGVVVALDLRCEADASWYAANQTQPTLAQPWYHVLVHGSGQTTYAAQTSLRADDCTDPIVHPLLPMFFIAFDGETYQRNDEPWPAS